MINSNIINCSPNSYSEPFIDPRTGSPGSSQYFGVALEVDFLIAENWDVSANWSFNDNEFTDYLINLVSSQTVLGTRNVKGRRSSRFPKWSGNVSSTYSGTFDNGWDWSLRGDLTYMGESFAGLTNLATLQSYSLMNVRFGVERENLRLEAYVKNLWDEETWRAGQEYTDFSRELSVGFNFTMLGPTLVPQEKRAFGLRATITFQRVA